MRLLKIVLLFSIVFISAKQIDGQNTFFFNQSGTFLRTDETATSKYIVDSLSETSLVLYYSVRERRKWSKPEFLQAAHKVSDSVFHIASDPAMNNSFVREFKTRGDLMYNIKQVDSWGNSQFECQALNVFPLIMHGTCTWFDIDGMPMIGQTYLNGRQLGERLLFNPVDSGVVITREPEFPGGEKGFKKYIATKVVLAHSKIGQGVGEKVFVKFRINEDGKVSDAHVVSGGDQSMAASLLAAVNETDALWQPAESEGKKIAVWHYATIQFGGTFMMRR